MEDNEDNDPPSVHLDLAMADAQFKLDTLLKSVRDYVPLLESLRSGKLQSDAATREKIRTEMLRLKSSIDGVTADHKALVSILRQATSTTRQ